MKNKTALFIFFCILTVCIPLFGNIQPLSYRFTQKQPVLELHSFLDTLGMLESNNKYDPKPENKNYWGKYQMHKRTLEDVGIRTNKDGFIKDTLLQERAIILLLRKNRLYCSDLIKEYTGRKINGIVISEAGILAAAHLGGSGNIRRFLKSNGKENFKDGNGTPISLYLKKFSSYALIF